MTERRTHKQDVSRRTCLQKYGAIGPDVGYAVGVAAAVQLGAGPQAAHKGHPVVCVTGDAGFGHTAMGIDTMAKYKLPVVVIVYNNNAWGTWTQPAREPRALPIHLFQENLRYDKMAEALGGHAAKIIPVAAGHDSADCSAGCTRSRTAYSK
jgi:thiamine pyrophosphate-dependent acetolactate synthase large subunit-like protein